MRISSFACVTLVGLAAIGSARAADPVPAARFLAAAPNYFDWTGVYLGLAFGPAFGKGKTDDTSGLGGSGGFNLRGGLIGGTVGANWQGGRWVIGVEGDVSYSTLTGNPVALAPITNITSLREKWLGTARVRWGGMPIDYLFTYVTGGVAVAGVEATVDFTPSGNPVTATSKQFRTGWTAGAGVEGAIGRNTSVKLEYLYVALDNPVYGFTSPPGFPINSSHFPLNAHVLRIGANLSLDGLGAFKW